MYSSLGGSPAALGPKELVGHRYSSLSRSTGSVRRVPLGTRTNDQSFMTPPIASKMHSRRETPRSAIIQSSRRPGGTVVRLKSQCKELDFQLADLETENNTLQDENSALKSSLRRQDEQIIVLEETNAELSLDLKRVTTAKAFLQQQHEAVLAAVAAQRWGPVEPECNCRTERDREITRLQIRLERMAENEQRLVGRAEQFRKEADEHESRWRLEKEKRLQSERLRSTAESDQMFLSVEVAGLQEQRELGQAQLQNLAAEVMGLRYQIEQGVKFESSLAASKHQVRPPGPQESARRTREAIEGAVITPTGETDRLGWSVIEPGMPAEAEPLPLPAAAPVAKETTPIASLEDFRNTIVSRRGSPPTMPAAVRATIDASVAARSAAATAGSPGSNSKSPTKTPLSVSEVLADAGITPAAPAPAMQLLAEAREDFTPTSTGVDTDVNLDITVAEAELRIAPATVASAVAPSAAMQLLAEAMGDFTPTSTGVDTDVNLDITVAEAELRIAPATVASAVAPSAAMQLLAEAMGDFTPANTRGKADAQPASATNAAATFASCAESQPPTPAKPAEPSDPKFGAIWRALYDYTATGVTDMSFSRGQVFKILNSSDAGWWRAKELATGAEGYVPSNYIIKSVEQLWFDIKSPAKSPSFRATTEETQPLMPETSLSMFSSV